MKKLLFAAAALCLVVVPGIAVDGTDAPDYQYVTKTDGGVESGWVMVRVHGTVRLLSS